MQSTTPNLKPEGSHGDQQGAKESSVPDLLNQAESVASQTATSPSDKKVPRYNSTPYVREFRSALARQGLKRVETHLDYETVGWIKRLAGVAGTTVPQYIRNVLVRHVGRHANRGDKS